LNTYIAVYINCNAGIKQEQESINFVQSGFSQEHESIFETQERSRSGRNQTPQLNFCGSGSILKKEAGSELGSI